MVVEIERCDHAYVHAGHLARRIAEAPLTGVLVASPANPSGAIPAAELSALIGGARPRHPVHLRRDLPPAGLRRAPATTALEF